MKRLVTLTLLFGFFFTSVKLIHNAAGWQKTDSLNAMDATTNKFRGGAYSQDYILGVTALGKVSYKLISNSGTTGTDFDLELINPFYYTSCWVDSNICVFAGYLQIEAYELSTGSQILKKVFKYSKSGVVNENKHRVVKTIALTSYFVSGDFANIGLTRWHLDKTTNAHLNTAADATGECEDIILIDRTPYLVGVFDNVVDLYLVDFTSMTTVRKFSKSATLNDGGRGVHISRFPDKFLIMMAQYDSSLSKSEFIYFDYSTGGIHGYHQSSYQTIVSAASVPKTSFIMWGTTGLLLIQRVDYPNYNNVQQNCFYEYEDSADTSPEIILWHPGSHKFLVVMERGLIFATHTGNVLNCARECLVIDQNDSSKAMTMKCNVPFKSVPSTCTDCWGQSYNPPNCNQNILELNDSTDVIDITTATFTGDEDSSAAVPGESITGVSVDPLSTEGVLSLQLPVLKDKENKTHNVLGYIVVTFFFLLLFILTCTLLWKAYRKGKVDKKVVEKEMKKKRKPIWAKDYHVIENI